MCFPVLPEVVKQCFNGITSCLCARLAGLRDGRSGSFTKAGKYGYCRTCMTPQRYKKLHNHHWSLQLYTLNTYHRNETWAVLLILCFKSCIWFLVLFFCWTKKVLFHYQFLTVHCICMHFSLLQMTDDHFKVLLAYLEGMRGASRSITLQKAEAIVRWEGQGEEEDTADAEKKKQRAKQVVQLLW